MTRQISQSGPNESLPSPSKSTSVTSLIPLPSPLQNNLGANMSPQQTNIPNKLDNHHNVSSHVSHHLLSSSTYHTPSGV
jgi:hypothetical protein